MKKIRKYQLGVVLILLIILSLACSSQFTVIETTVPVNAETLVAGTMAVYTRQAPSSTPTFVPTMTAIPVSPTPDIFGKVYVYTVVDNVNLRVNPGMLFKVSRVMPSGTRLLLFGQSPGGEWLYVQNDEDIIGWVNVNVVQISYDGTPPPYVEPADVLLVTGKVLTELDTPVSGIGYAVTQGERTTIARTDETGQFFAYLPQNTSGVWSVGYTAISCTSNTMDANCNCINKCGTSYPESTSVELPQKGMLVFVWK